MSSYVANNPVWNDSVENHSVEDNVNKTMEDVRQLAAETAEITVTKKPDTIQRHQERLNDDLEQR